MRETSLLMVSRIGLQQIYWSFLAFHITQRSRWYYFFSIFRQPLVFFIRNFTSEPLRQTSKLEWVNLFWPTGRNLNESVKVWLGNFDFIWKMKILLTEQKKYTTSCYRTMDQFVGVSSHHWRSPSPQKKTSYGKLFYITPTFILHNLWGIVALLYEGSNMLLCSVIDQSFILTIGWDCCLFIHPFENRLFLLDLFPFSFGGGVIWIQRLQSRVGFHTLLFLRQ